MTGRVEVFNHRGRGSGSDRSVTKTEKGEPKRGNPKRHPKTEEPQKEQRGTQKGTPKRGTQKGTPNPGETKREQRGTKREQVPARHRVRTVHGVSDVDTMFKLYVKTKKGLFSFFALGIQNLAQKYN